MFANLKPKQPIFENPTILTLLWANLNYDYCEPVSAPEPAWWHTSRRRKENLTWFLIMNFSSKRKRKIQNWENYDDEIMKWNIATSDRRPSNYIKLCWTNNKIRFFWYCSLLHKQKFMKSLRLLRNFLRFWGQANPHQIF